MSARLLIVDPGLRSGRQMARAVAASGYDVALSRDPDDARAAARISPPDLIIIVGDTLPQAGQLLTRGFRRAPDTSGIPVMLTTTHEDADPCAAFDSGAEDVVRWPAPRPEFLARVRRLVGLRLALDELSPDRAFEGPSRAPANAIELRAAITGSARILRAGGRVPGGPDPLQFIADLSRTPAAVATSQKALADLAQGADADLVILDPAGNYDGEVLALIPWLRANPRTRNAMILYLSEPVPDADGGSDIAAPGLSGAVLAADLGADDVVAADASHAEKWARAAALIRRKRRLDRCRSIMRDNLAQALTDPLTRLHNRRYALDHLERMRAEAMARGESMALLMVDIDKFKRINDTYGHAAGDRVLRDVASWLRNSVRAGDLIARFGGEEFVIGIPSTTTDEAGLAAERIRGAVASAVIPVCKDAGSGGVTVSVGIALSDPDHEEDLSDIMARADAALYRSKASGRNCVRLDGAQAA